MENLQWWQRTVVYQIYPKSFADTTGSGQGDLQGIIGRLDYLRELGVGAVWLTPVYRSPMIDNGYDIEDYCSIDPAYGTMDDMEILIGEAKKRGIRIVMDLVFNHSSDQHEWFQQSRQDRKNDKQDWYIWHDAKVDGSAPTNWRSIFGGSAWTFDERRGQYYLHTFAKEQPDLNWENPQVRRALYAATKFWLSKGVGGFRIDAITYIKKPEIFQDVPADHADGTVNIHTVTANTPGILDFLQEFRREVFDGHDIFTVAEANGVAADELKFWVGPQGAFDMLFEFSHTELGMSPENLWFRPRTWKLTELKQALTSSQLATTQNGWYPIFFENHDQVRAINHFFPAGADPVLAGKAMAMILFSLRGTPFIYQGQELGYTNMALSSIEAYDDISSKGQYALALEEGFSSEEALAFVQRFSRDNARTPMQWSAASSAGFSTGTPWLPVHDDYETCNVAEETKRPDSLLSWYKRLSRLRQSEAALLAGTYHELLVDDERIYGFERICGRTEIRILVNFTLQKAALDEQLLSEGCFLLGNYSDAPVGGLRPLEAVLYLVERSVADEDCRNGL